MTIRPIESMESSYIDEENLLHIDAYFAGSEEGMVIATVDLDSHKVFFLRNEYYLDPDVNELIENIKKEHPLPDKNPPIKEAFIGRCDSQGIQYVDAYFGGDENETETPVAAVDMENHKVVYMLPAYKDDPLVAEGIKKIKEANPLISGFPAVMVHKTEDCQTAVQEVLIDLPENQIPDDEIIAMAFDVEYQAGQGEEFYTEKIPPLSELSSLKKAVESLKDRIADDPKNYQFVVKKNPFESSYWSVCLPGGYEDQVVRTFFNSKLDAHTWISGQMEILGLQGIEIKIEADNSDSVTFHPGVH